MLNTFSQRSQNKYYLFECMYEESFNLEHQSVVADQ